MTLGDTNNALESCRNLRRHVCIPQSVHQTQRQFVDGIGFAVIAFERSPAVESRTFLKGLTLGGCAALFTSMPDKPAQLDKHISAWLTETGARLPKPAPPSF